MNQQLVPWYLWVVFHFMDIDHILPVHVLKGILVAVKLSHVFFIVFISIKKIPRGVSSS